MQHNILVINWQDITNPLGGGAEVHLHEIFKRVAANGHRVTLLSCHYSGAQHEEMVEGIRIIRRGKRSAFNFIVPSAYKALAANQRFDIVFDDINKIPFFTPFYIKEPLIAIVHHFFGQSIFLETAIPQASYVYLTERFVPPVYAGVPFAVVSESTRRELVRKGVRSKISLLPNGVDCARYAVIDGGKSKTPLVGYLGRLKKYKSIEHFLQAIPRILQQIPDTRFVVIGEGNYRRNLEHLACALAIDDKVEFIGIASHREKVVLLNQMWVAVNPSPKEGWGLTVIEANACQTPVVAANSPGLCDSIVDKKTGILYEYGNVQQLSDAVCRLIHDDLLRNKMSVEARKWAESHNWDSSADLAVKLINETLSWRK